MRNPQLSDKLSSLIQSVQNAKHILAQDPPVDYRVRAGFEMSQAQAKRDIVELEKKLAAEISDIAVPVFVDGEKAAVLAETMKDQTSLAIVDLDKVYGTLVQSVEATIGRSREFGVTQFSKIVTTLRQTAVESGLAGVNVPSFGEPVIVPSAKETADVVMKFCNQIVGPELALQFVRTEAAKQAVVEIEGKVAVFPVLILSAPESVRDALTKAFKKPLSLTLTATNEPNEEEAIKALKTIKTALKTKDN